MRMPPAATHTFKTPARTFVKENVSVITSRGSRKARRAVLANGPDGNGLPTILIPGFLTGDWSMRVMSSALKEWNFAPRRSGIALNVACTNVLVDRLVDRLHELTDQHQRRVALVGWSRGGTLAKLIAMRSPQEVAGMVTLVSPNANPLAVNTVVERQLRALNRLNAMGASGVLGADCISGDCAKSVEAALNAQFPSTVPYVSMYTKSDGVVDWRACLDPDARVIEVTGTHLGVGNDLRVVRDIAEELVVFSGDYVPAQVDRQALGHDVESQRGERATK